MTENVMSLLIKCKRLLKIANAFYNNYPTKFDSDYKSVLFFHFAKAKSLFKTLLTLVENDEWQNIGIISRSIFECYLSINFIEKDTIERSELFLDYQKVEKYEIKNIRIKYWDDLHSKNDNKNLFIKEKIKFEQENKNIISNKKKYKIFRRIEEMANDIKGETLKDYYLYYKPLCCESHTSPSSHHRYLKIDYPIDYRKTYLDVTYNEIWIGVVLYRSFKYFLYILKSFNISFYINKTDLLKKIEKSMNNLIGEDKE